MGITFYSGPRKSAEKRSWDKLCKLHSAAYIPFKKASVNKFCSLVIAIPSVLSYALICSALCQVVFYRYPDDLNNLHYCIRFLRVELALSLHCLEAAPYFYFWVNRNYQHMWKKPTFQLVHWWHLGTQHAKIIRLELEAFGRRFSQKCTYSLRSLTLTSYDGTTTIRSVFGITTCLSNCSICGITTCLSKCSVFGITTCLSKFVAVILIFWPSPSIQNYC